MDDYDLNDHEYLQSLAEWMDDDELDDLIFDTVAARDR